MSEAKRKKGKARNVTYKEASKEIMKAAKQAQKAVEELGKIRDEYEGLAALADSDNKEADRVHELTRPLEDFTVVLRNEAEKLVKYLT